jgi:Spy/CpxP family protein refolding chaperone
MKSSVKVILAALALSTAAFVSTGSAQEQKKGRGGGGLTVERIEQAVGTLSAEQKTKIEGIIAKAREAMQGAQGDQDKMREIGTKQRADIRAVLTADQQKKFDEMPQGGKGGGKKKNQ